jgi:hypothetical protein
VNSGLLACSCLTTLFSASLRVRRVVTNLRCKRGWRQVRRDVSRQHKSVPFRKDWALRRVKTRLSSVSCLGFTNPHNFVHHA